METFDLESLTLGEALAAEDASGLDLTVLLSRTGHRRMLGAFVLALRSSGRPPKWSELAGQRIFDTLTGPSPSPVDNP